MGLYFEGGLQRYYIGSVEIQTQGPYQGTIGSTLKASSRKGVPITRA